MTPLHKAIATYCGNFKHVYAVRIRAIFFAAVGSMIPVTAHPNDQSEQLPIQSLDQGSAQPVLPYAAMACGAYSECNYSKLSEIGFVKDISWQTALRRAGAGKNVIELYESSGFSATIFRNDRTKEFVIAYRGTDESMPLGPMAMQRLRSPGDWQTNLDALSMKTPQDRLVAQYVAARSLAARLNAAFSKTPYADYQKVSLTGHSLGGALASYAGQHTKVDVYTVAPARSALVGTTNDRQINIVPRGDPVSDPNATYLGVRTGRRAGSVSALPGRTHVVDMPSTLNPVGKHDVSKILAQLNAIASGQNLHQSQKPRLPNSPLPAFSSPGGISLTKAAAEGMPLKISLDGAYFQNGRIVLSGRQSEHGIDAALLLTALRATCDGHDPYFSLDPDDIASWLRDAQNANDELVKAIENDLKWNLQKKATRKTPSILKLRTISATRDYPHLWTSLLKKYPALRSRLVFGPQWLRETRFGQILYEADVLLKELAGGVSAFPARSFRASTIEGYISPPQWIAARHLLHAYHNIPETASAKAGGRIWYDLTEADSLTLRYSAKRVWRYSPKRVFLNSELQTLLKQRGVFKDAPAGKAEPMSLMKNDEILDLTSIYPRMYIRVRDPITMQDGSGSFPGLDEMAEEANRSPEKYASGYPEYEALVQVFRAYVVAVHASRIELNLCSKLPKSLTDGEKVEVPLPLYHPTDLAMTIGWYEYSTKKHRKVVIASGGLFQGGVSVGATRFLKHNVQASSDTPIIRELKAHLTAPVQEPVWRGESGRQFVAFVIDEPAPSIIQPQQIALNSPTKVKSPEHKPLLEASPSKPQLTPRQAAVLSARTNDPARPPRDFMALATGLALLLIIGALFFLLVRSHRQVRPANVPDRTGRYPNGAWAMPDLSNKIL